MNNDNNDNNDSNDSNSTFDPPSDARENDPPPPSEPRPSQPLNVRAKRGLALARAKKDLIKPLAGTSKWLVPSSSGNGSRYVVDPIAESCTCLDWAAQGGHERRFRCKHVFAVHFAQQLASGVDLGREEPALKRPRKVKDPRNWKKRDWRAINKCRTLIPRLGPQLLAELIDGAGLPEPIPGKRGAPAISDRDILVAAAIREWEGKTAAEAEVAIELFCELKRIRLSRRPAYNTILERFAKPELMPFLHKILAASALPLLRFESGFSADGTGFGSSIYDHYFADKHIPNLRRKPTKRHSWIGAMIAWGIDTHVIVAAQPTVKHPDGGEVQIMPELLRRAIANGAQVRAWYGDAGFLAEQCAEACERVGAEFYVDFYGKRGVTGKTKKGALHRLYYKMRTNPEEYRRRYEKGHPLCETGNSMIKERFGPRMRSRKANAQYAEFLLRCICHNVACLIVAVKELGIEAKYWDHDLISKLPEFGSTQPTVSAGVTTDEDEDE